MKRWVDPAPVEVPDALKRAVGGHPLVAELLARRGLTDPNRALAFLDPERYVPASPADLPEMDRAVARVEQAIQARETICVWGDFDVDGQTSTTLLVEALRGLGAQVFHRIPLREESHGVNLPGLGQVLAGGTQLLLTCDTGSAEVEAVALARARGVDVVVTDHHDLPPKLPAARALVNPQRLPPDHPLRHLPGVGVAFQLARALYERAGRAAEVERYLDLVALGIVADVAVQTGDTRYLLQKGLQRLRRTERPGLRALVEAAELDPSCLSEEHISFALGPRLNALGRLADANLAVELLTTDDRARTRLLANQIEGLNARRKLLCDQVYRGAVEQVERDPSLLEGAALVLDHPSWPPGVIGIVASRLAETYHKPVVLISTPPGRLGRGSARSVPGVHLSRAIASQADLLASFGGHPMAAGLAIQPERIPAFRRGLSDAVQATLEAADVRPELLLDAVIPLGEVSLELAEQLERLAPFGPGNPVPVLASRDLVLTTYRQLGRGGEHRRLVVEGEGGVLQEVLWWQGGNQPVPKGKFELAYAVRAGTYRGARAVQLEWIAARLSGGEPAARAEQVEVVDHRGARDLHAALGKVRAAEPVLVWREAARGVAGVDRYALFPAEALVIWTVPPGPRELAAALERVSPRRVYLFGANAGHDEPAPFLKQLAGLCKFALRARGGQVSVERLASASAQREEAVHLGLRWLSAKGLFNVTGEGTAVRLTPGEGRSDPAGGADLSRRLRSLLAESAAYRRHFGRATKERLLPS